MSVFHLFNVVTKKRMCRMRHARLKIVRKECCTRIHHKILCVNALQSVYSLASSCCHTNTYFNCFQSFHSLLMMFLLCSKEHSVDCIKIPFQRGKRKKNFTKKMRIMLLHSYGTHELTSMFDSIKPKCSLYY